jgi:hypothetical protein
MKLLLDIIALTVIGTLFLALLAFVFIGSFTVPIEVSHLATAGIMRNANV